MKNHNNQPGICRSDCPNGNTGSSDQISQTNKNGRDQTQMIKHYNKIKLIDTSIIPIAVKPVGQAVG